jgi:hypothetical protein
MILKKEIIALTCDLFSNYISGSLMQRLFLAGRTCVKFVCNLINKILYWKNTKEMATIIILLGIGLPLVL